MKVYILQNHKNIWIFLSREEVFFDRGSIFSEDSEVQSELVLIVVVKLLLALPLLIG